MGLNYLFYSIIIIYSTSSIRGLRVSSSVSLFYPKATEQYLLWRVVYNYYRLEPGYTLRRSGGRNSTGLSFFILFHINLLHLLMTILCYNIIRLDCMIYSCFSRWILLHILRLSIIVANYFYQVLLRSYFLYNIKNMIEVFEIIASVV